MARRVATHEQETGKGKAHHDAAKAHDGSRTGQHDGESEADAGGGGYEDEGDEGANRRTLQVATAAD